MAVEETDRFHSALVRADWRIRKGGARRLVTFLERTDG
jgi:hypothetical protein